VGGGCLIASIAEYMRPTVPGARRVPAASALPALGQLSGWDLNGVNTRPSVSWPCGSRLAPAHADLRTIVLVDLDCKHPRDTPTHPPGFSLAAAADRLSLQALSQTGRVSILAGQLSGLVREGERQPALERDNEPTLGPLIPPPSWDENPEAL